MDKLVKADRAKAILSDDVFKEALDVIESRHVGVFKHPNSTDEEIMEASRMVRAAVLVKGQLQSFVDDGRLLERKKQKGSAP